MTPTSPDELARLRVLARLDLGDPPSVPELDALVRSAAALTDSPMACIGLVSEREVRYPARWGIDNEWLPRDGTFCTHAIDAGQALVVPDAVRDERFAAGRMPAGPSAPRSYLGVPLLVDGQPIGTLCVLGQRPREFTPQELDRVRDLALAAQGCLQARLQRSPAAGRAEVAEQPGRTPAERIAELEVACAQAEAANQAKARFLAAMSHEIRTPMSGVVGIADVLGRASLTPYQADLVGTIRESATALLRIIDDILDFSKAEAGKLRLECEPVDLTRLVEAACDALEPLAAERGVQMRVFVDPALPPTVRTDPLRLRQILNNLVGNAIKFSSGLGRPGRVQLRCEPAGEGSLRLRVLDNGIGVARDEQDELFQPFRQSAAAGTRRFGGTGLGLSICGQLVELFGGRIRIGAAAAGTPGTVVTVELPLRVYPNPLAAPRPLDGLRCQVWLQDQDQAQDWARYLEAAGASVRVWPDLEALGRALEGDRGPRPVLVIEAPRADGHGPARPAWPPTRDGQVLPMVRIGRGRRRRPRGVPAVEVELDLDQLRRDALWQAVAMADGREWVDERDQSLDRDRASPQATVPPRNEAAALGRLILVAEDNQINQIVIRHQLALLGLAADIAEDGQDALKRWRQQGPAWRYGLVLTDLRMPRLDGLSLAAAIRGAERDGERLPIVALTADAEIGDQMCCRAVGIDECLTKPIDLDRLRDVLAALLPQRGVTPEPPAPAPASGSQAVVTAEARVLLVDDEEGELAWMQRQLDAMGAPPVTACSSAHGALAWLRGRDTAATLLLLDLAMPDMDGVELMRQLADDGYDGALALVSGADVRVLETATKLAQAYQLNVLSHLHKPVPPATLKGLIDRWRGYTPAPARAGGHSVTPQEIRRAIERHELRLHYQPKVSIEGGAWVGVEALVRWQHPAHGLLFPDSFVATAEAEGLIDELTQNVLDLAVMQMQRWRQAGRAVKVAVNVSMDNLARLDFPERVLEAAARGGVTPTDLMLEVTETRLMRDARAALDILTRLRLKQIRLSIDDFGTGHSSLAQLRDIPFDELKIDRGFVHGSREQPTQRAIFRASVDMAHELGMAAVAEGVEDQADWDFVRAAGCDVAQGYFIGRPMPAAELPDWAAAWRARFESI